MDHHPMDLLASAMDELEAHNLIGSYFAIHVCGEYSSISVNIDDRAAMMRAFGIPTEAAAARLLQHTHGGVHFYNLDEEKA